MKKEDIRFGDLAAVVIAIVVVAIQQLAAWLASRNQKVESVTQGDMTILVADGILQLENMGKNGITKERAFAQLRSNGIVHPGQVKRLYFEAAGTFTFIREDKPSPGLGILPADDHAFALRRYHSSDRMVCGRCGLIAPYQEYSWECARCGGDEVMVAVE